MLNGNVSQSLKNGSVAHISFFLGDFFVGLRQKPDVYKILSQLNCL